MKTHRILKSFDALAQDESEQRAGQDRPETGPVQRQAALSAEVLHAFPHEEFPPVQPYRRWGINE